MTCWSCNENVAGPVCVGCGAVQPPPAEPDPYAIFGLARRFHLDVAELEGRYRALARVVHPDRVTTRPAVERRMALQWTATINAARRTLKDDEARGRFLATGKAQVGETGPKLDPAFLAEMFEWREADEEEPGSMAAKARALAAELHRELDTIYTTWEEGRGDLTAVEDRLARLKYVTGLLPRETHGEHRN